MAHVTDFAGSSLVPPPTITISILAGIIFILGLIFLIIHFQNRRLSFSHKLKEFLIWSGFLFLGIAALAASVFLTTPKITSVAPVSSAVDADPATIIAITFDKPVGRRLMGKTINPDVPGTWVFEDPLYSTHLYRRLVYYPDTTFNSGTDYKVKLTGIENTLGTSKPYDFEFSFKTKTNALIAQATAKTENLTFKLPVPVYLQQHTLSCELASLRMALDYKGITKSEDELLNQVGVDNTPHKGGVWGNPYERFVGNVNGTQMKDGYGVYWGPIERVAKMYGGALAFQNGTISQLTRAIRAGNPVIIWVYSKNGAPTHWKTPDGLDIFAVSGEHTVVAVGFVGPADNPTQIIVNDSLIGQSYWSRSLFDRKWATFNQAGVVVYK